MIFFGLRAPGLPETVKMSHIDLRHAINTVGRWEGITPGGTLISLFPYSHVAGAVVSHFTSSFAGICLITGSVQGTALMPIKVGCTGLLLPSDDLSAFLSGVENHKATASTFPCLLILPRMS